MDLGRITVSGRANVTFYDDFINDGTLQVSTGSTAVFFGGFTGAHGSTGTGTVFLEGDLRPGHSPGALSFGGDLVLGSDFMAHMELAGLTPGSEYDTISVGGLLTFGGTLDVLLLDAFRPNHGDSFDLFDWGSSTGTFISLSLPGLDGGLSWDTSRLYTDGVLTAIPEPTTYAALLGVATLGIVICRRCRAQRRRVS